MCHSLRISFLRVEELALGQRKSLPNQQPSLRPSHLSRKRKRLLLLLLRLSRHSRLLPLLAVCASQSKAIHQWATWAKMNLPCSFFIAFTGGRVFASPLARKIAAEQGVNVGAVPGTGPNDRVIRADVLEYAGTPLPIIRQIISLIVFSSQGSRSCSLRSYPHTGWSLYRHSHHADSQGILLPILDVPHNAH